jgi:hypothetical protein
MDWAQALFFLPYLLAVGTWKMQEGFFYATLLDSNGHLCPKTVSSASFSMAPFRHLIHSEITK